MVGGLYRLARLSAAERAIAGAPGLHAWWLAAGASRPSWHTGAQLSRLDWIPWASEEGARKSGRTCQSSRCSVWVGADLQRRS
jgi:hypothetical protein